MLAIALIPCAAFLVTGTTFVVTLANEARAADRWAEYLNEQLDSFVGFIVAVQDERTTSFAALNGDPSAMSDLVARRAKTDSALSDAARIAPTMQELNPEAVVKANPAFMRLAVGTPIMRRAVDVRQATTAEVDDFYTQLAGVVATGIEGLARHTPEALTSSELMTASALMQAAELHSRAAGIAAATAADGPLFPEDRRMVAQLVGGYRHQLEGLVSQLADDDRARYRKLIESPEWHTATQGQDELAEQGILAVPYPEWQAAERAVDAELVAMFRDHFEFATTTAADAADRTLDRLILAGAAVAIAATLAFVPALLLANRLVRRLRSLRSRSLELANETLPSIIQRLHDGELIDLDAEVTVVDSGSDEIGQVADAFSTAQRTAMTVAATEARTRSGFNRVFLDIARRNQVVVRRQLDVLDIAEAKQNDPEHLELLFQLDHLATRARRNAENLLILGGGQAGRRWRDPVALEQIVRSAVSETHDLTRVSAIRLPEAYVLGNVVADLIHLLAELIDNATTFSPPQALVSVHGNLVGRGVVVQVEDQGLGLRSDERERLNQLLADPPDFQKMALAGQRNLGLFVVGRLARRHSIAVNLEDSAYGGIKAVVLIPVALLSADPSADDADPSGAPGTGAHRRIPPPPPSAASEQVHHLPGRNGPQEQPQPSGEPVGLPTAEPPVNGASHRLEPPRPTSRQRAPLPRRQRLAHLAPELQWDEANPDRNQPLHQSRRPADEIRNSMSSFQRGTHHARESAADSNQ
ncbi:sensor histidine kinase [Nocardia xishanensis]|uniref:sensor histidine kinase n=1 Tax=Nocardia xishanensis TaxID=238964 RepID=UPI00083130F2|nr:ATP-binding protein [Nocardia xishanensis]